MSSVRSSTATNSPKRLVTPANSTATPLPASGPAPLASGGCSVVLSCTPLPPVRVTLRGNSLRKPGPGEIREHLMCHSIAGLYGPVHVPIPFRGCFGPGPVDAAHRLGQRRTVVQKHTRNRYPRVPAARIGLGPPVGLRVGQRPEGFIPEKAGEALENGPLALLGPSTPPLAGVGAKNEACQDAGLALWGRVVAGDLARAPVALGASVQSCLAPERRLVDGVAF